MLAGSGVPISNYMSVHDAATGLPFPGFPAESQGLDFLGAPAIADVTGDGQPEVLEGGGQLGAPCLQPGTGAQAPGFPKFTSGWVVFTPATGDLFSDGKTEVVANTREGYINVWKTDGTAAGNNEWWNGRHDERNTGEYGVDTRPPGILRDAAISADGTQIDFTAPGDDWYDGTPDHYVAVTSSDPITPDNFDQATPLSDTPTPGAAGTAQSYGIPGDAQRYVAIRAVDDAGNLGPIHDLDRGAAAGGGGGGGNGGSGGSGARGRAAPVASREPPATGTPASVPRRSRSARRSTRRAPAGSAASGRTASQPKDLEQQLPVPGSV